MNKYSIQATIAAGASALILTASAANACPIERCREWHPPLIYPEYCYDLENDYEADYNPDEIMVAAPEEVPSGRP